MKTRPRVNAQTSIEMMKCEAMFQNSTGTMTADTAFDDKGFTYIVRSYGVPIAEVRHDEIKNEQGKVIGCDRKVWITSLKYSVTTSKHTTYARRALVVTK